MSTPAQTVAHLVADCDTSSAGSTPAYPRLLCWWYLTSEEEPWTLRVTSFDASGNRVDLSETAPDARAEYRSEFASVARAGVAWTLEPDITQPAGAALVPSRLTRRLVANGEITHQRSLPTPSGELLPDGTTIARAVVADDLGERVWVFFDRSYPPGEYELPYAQSYWMEVDPDSLVTIADPTVLHFDLTTVPGTVQGWTFSLFGLAGTTDEAPGNVTFAGYDELTPTFAAISIGPDTWETTQDLDLFTFSIESNGTFIGTVSSLGGDGTSPWRLWRRRNGVFGYVAWADYGVITTDLHHLP